MVSASGSGRSGSYTGSSGPRHSSQIATGAGGCFAPQRRQACGSGLRDGSVRVVSRSVTRAVVISFLRLTTPIAGTGSNEKRPVPKRHAGREAF